MTPFPWLAGAVAALAVSTTSHAAAIRIADDRGGRIGTYVERYVELERSGQAVVIDGLCASACTIVLSALPAERICVTEKARLGFHGAWNAGRGGRRIPNPEATAILYASYPQAVRRWIDARGGLKADLVVLAGAKLRSMYRPCTGAQIAAARHVATGTKTASTRSAGAAVRAAETSR